MADYLQARFTYDPGRVKVWRAIVQDLEKRFILIQPNHRSCHRNHYGD